MATITDYFTQAQLSLAAYALNLQPGMSNINQGDTYRALLVEAGMSATQATEFAKKYSVIAQSPENDPSGFSGTLFADTTGKVYVALRGTEGLFSDDFILTDLGDIAFDGIAIDQAIAMFNWLQRLKGLGGEQVVQYHFIEEFNDIETGELIPAHLATTVTAATGELHNSSAPLSVAGHSLGGHLAMILSRLAPGLIDSVYTYNAPGFDDPTLAVSPLTSEGFFSLFNNAPEPPITGAIGADWNGSIMSHLDVEGDVAHGIGNTPGVPQIVFSEGENRGIRDAHSIAAITDSLALYDLFAKLDPALNTNTTLALTEITDILKASASDHTKSLENALDAIRRILSSTDIAATPKDDRNAFYTNYYALLDPTNPETNPEGAAFAQLAGNATLSTLVDKSQLNLEALAVIPGANGLPYRYALAELNPFALLGADYETLHNAAGQLNLYDPATRTGTLTNAWLEDRSAFLVNKLLAGVTDSQVGGFPAVTQSAELQHFEDRSGAAPYHVYAGANAAGLSSAVLPVSDVKQILFGGDGVDSLIGNDQVDKLYGAAGNDLLTGAKGDDYLEGGDGNDTYRFYSGDGNDTILDIAGVVSRRVATNRVVGLYKNLLQEAA
jgi:RTX calcium-binding nonapeptide repeat (4 copies)